MTGKIKEKTLKSALEADDLMAAALVAPVVRASGGAQPSSSEIALERVKLTGTLNTNLQKVGEAKERINSTLETLKAQIKSIETPATHDAAAKLVVALEKDYAEAHKHLEEQQCQYDASLRKVASVESMARLKELRKQGTEELKKLGAGAMKAWGARQRIVTNWVNTTRRHAAQASEPQADDASDKPVPGHERFAGIVATTGQRNHNIGSVFEAKAGHRASTLMPTGDPVASLQNLPVVKRPSKALNNHLKNNAWGVSPKTGRQGRE